MPPARLLRIAFLAIVTAAAAPPPAVAGFEGKLVLEPPGCEASGKCTLGADFGFVDGSGTGWQAAKGLLTDGASIPRWAQPIVGAPFTDAFVKAAIIHDHYCVRHVRTWRQTHKVFHEALLASGVPAGKAGIMYFAVLVGGPKWVELVKGKPCPVGMGCVNQFDVTASVTAGQIAFGSDGRLFMSRADIYDTAKFENTLREKLPALEKKGDTLTVEEVEAAAQAAMTGDFYFVNGDQVGTTIGVTIDFE